MKYLNDRGQEPNSDTHYYSSSGNNMRVECRIGTMANICHSYFVVEAKAHSKITSNIELSSVRGVGGRVNKETTAAEREQHAQALSLYYYVCPPFNGRDRRIIIVFPQRPPRPQLLVHRLLFADHYTRCCSGEWTERLRLSSGESRR